MLKSIPAELQLGPIPPCKFIAQCSSYFFSVSSLGLFSLPQKFIAHCCSPLSFNLNSHSHLQLILLPCNSMSMAILNALWLNAHGHPHWITTKCLQLIMLLYKFCMYLFWYLAFLLLCDLKPTAILVSSNNARRNNHCQAIHCLRLFLLASN